MSAPQSVQEMVNTSNQLGGQGDAFPWGAGHGTLRDTRK